MSSVFDAQDALLAAIKTKAAITDVCDPTLGFPAGGVLTRHVWVDGGVTDWTQEWDTSAVSAKHENFTLTVRVLVADPTDDYTVVRDSMEVLLEAVESALSSDYTLNDTVLMAQVASIDMQEGIDDGNKRRELGAAVRVRCVTHHA